ncbi:MAG TPA: sulfatase-like hydrolase/transferase, partial [Planctomycetaceae bacterium]
MHLRSSETTVAELLKQAGYETCHVGKWHLNGKFNDAAQPQPGDHGFDHWFATQNNAAPSHENPRNFVRNGEPVGPLEGFSCHIVADEAIGWLKGRKGDAPFFLFVCFHEPHEPVASPGELVATYLDGEGPQARNEDEAQYFANVTNMDAAVGRLLAALKAQGVDEETLVVFTSDNGPETLKRYPRGTRSYGSPGPLRGMKLWLYEAGIRVPGIVRWPGVLPAGDVNDTPVGSVDLLPTLCELAGVKPPEDRPLDGTSLVPLLAGEPFERERPLSWDYYNALGGPKAAMRVGDLSVLAKRATPDVETVDRRGGNVGPQTMPVIKSETLGGFEL